MSLLNVNPNRMEMNNLKRKLEIAKRGHVLLKEKQDALIREYVQLVEEARNARLAVEEMMRQLHQHYKISSMQMDDRSLQRVLGATQRENRVKTKREYLQGVTLIHYDLEPVQSQELTYSVVSTPASLDQVTNVYPTILPELIELANQEKKCYVLSHELRITRRRVNSLEYKTIPQLSDTIRSIQLKIDDQERTQIARSMKVAKK